MSQEVIKGNKSEKKSKQKKIDFFVAVFFLLFFNIVYIILYPFPREVNIKHTNIYTLSNLYIVNKQTKYKFCNCKVEQSCIFVFPIENKNK